jgi:hypothetical protein
MLGIGAGSLVSHGKDESQLGTTIPFPNSRVKQALTAGAGHGLLYRCNDRLILPQVRLMCAPRLSRICNGIVVSPVCRRLHPSNSRLIAST